MSLDEKYLPHYHFQEIHALKIRATPAQVMQAVLNYHTQQDLFFRYAIALRELPIRLLDKLVSTDPPHRPAFSLDNFTSLEHIDNQSIIFGLVGKFWTLDYGQQPISDAASFLTFNQAGSAKLTLSFTIKELDSEHVKLTTETRIFCRDREALRRFTPYWYLIRPVSGLIRYRILTGIRRHIKRNLQSC